MRYAVGVAGIRIVASITATIARVVGGTCGLWRITGGQSDDGKCCQRHAGDVLEVEEIDAHKNRA